MSAEKIEESRAYARDLLKSLIDDYDAVDVDDQFWRVIEEGDQGQVNHAIDQLQAYVLEAQRGRVVAEVRAAGVSR